MNNKHGHELYFFYFFFFLHHRQTFKLLTSEICFKFHILKAERRNELSRNELYFRNEN